MLLIYCFGSVWKLLVVAVKFYMKLEFFLSSFFFFSSLANPASLAQFEGDIKGQSTKNISRSSKLD